MDDGQDLRALGESRDRNKALYNFSEPDPEVLETIPAPQRGDGVALGEAFARVDIEAPEFTSLCPVTGQPDFATIKINYAPDELCVESKSLKLYLMGFRCHGAFHEEIVNQIAHDLVRLLHPVALTVVGHFRPRGGITITPYVEYQRD